MRALLVVTLLLCAAACARDNRTRDGGVQEFDIGGIPFRMSSGTAREEGGALGIYFTDQPDACLAIRQIPAGLSTVLALRVAPRGDGMTAADVVARTGDPGAGEAIGFVRATAAGVETAKRTAADGTIAWTRNEDGTTTVTMMDVGFMGTDARVTTAGELTIPPCE